MTPEPLSDEEFEKIADYVEQSSQMIHVTAVKRLIATVRSREAENRRFRKALMEAAEYLSQSFFTREELVLAERIRALLLGNPENPK